MGVSDTTTKANCKCVSDTTTIATETPCVVPDGFGTMGGTAMGGCDAECKKIKRVETYEGGFLVSTVHAGYLKMIKITKAGDQVPDSAKYVSPGKWTESNTLKSEYESDKTHVYPDPGYQFVKGGGFGDWGCTGEQATNTATETPCVVPDGFGTMGGTAMGGCDAECKKI